MIMILTMKTKIIIITNKKRNKTKKNLKKTKATPYMIPPKIIPKKIPYLNKTFKDNKKI